MARKHGKNQQKKKEADVVSAALKSVKAKETTNPLAEGELWGDFNDTKKAQQKRAALGPAKFEMGDGHEDFPYKKGTMQDVGREFADEFGIMALPTKEVSLLQFVAILAVVGAITYGVFVALAPLA